MLPHFRRAEGEIAKQARLAHAEDPINLAKQPRHESRPDVADVEDPAGVASQIAGDRRLDVRPGDELCIDRLLDQAVVEKACRAITGAVHGDETDRARRGIERLREPSRVAGDFVGTRRAGHAAP